MPPGRVPSGCLQNVTNVTHLFEPWPFHGDFGNFLDGVRSARPYLLTPRKTAVTFVTALHGMGLYLTNMDLKKSM